MKKDLDYSLTLIAPFISILLIIAVLVLKKKKDESIYEKIIIRICIADLIFEIS